MDIVGYVFLALIALGVLAAIGFFMASISDIRRYFKMRKM
jgi:hypothetical protein